MGILEAGPGVVGVQYPEMEGIIFMELGRGRGTEPVSPAVHCLGAEISGGIAYIYIYAVVPGIDLEDAGHRVGRELDDRRAGV